jgi:benzoylformate decarboxylase
MLFGKLGSTELPCSTRCRRPTMRYCAAAGSAVAMAAGSEGVGSLSAVSLHLAPGLGNAMGMLYNAHKAASPVLLLVGQHEQSFATTEPILSGDVAGMARPLVKWAGEVPRLRDLPRMLHRAAKTAMAPPTGPVLLSLPQDVLIERDEIDLQEPTRWRRAYAARRRDRRRRRVAVGGAASGDRRRRRGGAEPRACRARRAGGAARAGLPSSSPAPPRFPPRIRCFMARWCRAPAVRQVPNGDVLLSIGPTSSPPVSQVDAIPSGCASCTSMPIRGG